MGGVDVFLVIGGYFITNKLLNLGTDRINVCSLFIHRIKRLYPLYFALLLAFCLICWLSKRKLGIEPLWYLFCLQNFRCLTDFATYHLDGYIGHFWYIGLDVWLFFLWLVLLKCVSKEKLRITFITTLVAGLIWRTAFILWKPENIALSYVIPVGLLDCWSVGGLLSMSIRKRGSNNKIMWSELLLGVLGIMAMVCYNAYRHSVSWANGYMLFNSAKGYMDNVLTGNIHFFIALLSAGILRYCLDTTRNHAVLSASALVALGGMTYELYCFHYPIILLVKHIVHNPVMIILLALLITYMVAIIWCRYIMPGVNRLFK